MQSSKMSKTPLTLLIESLIQKGVITNERVYKAMSKVDRGDFCPNTYMNGAYDDCP